MVHKYCLTQINVLILNSPRKRDWMLACCFTDMQAPVKLFLSPSAFPLVGNPSEVSLAVQTAPSVTSRLVLTKIL